MALDATICWIARSGFARQLLSALLSGVLAALPVHAFQNEDALLAEANRLASRFAYTDAEKLYQRFLSAQPQNAVAHHMYGRTLALQTKYEEALHEYKSSLKIKPNSASVLNDIGVTLSISGFQALGARFLNQASKLDINYPGALNNLGVVLSSLDAFKQSRDVFARSLELQPRNSKIKELKTKVESRLQESKDFDFGAAVTWKDVPDSLKRITSEPQIPDADKGKTDAQIPALAIKPELPPKAMDEADKKWLESAQPLFMEMKTSGFSNASFSGNGMLQVGDKSDSADNIGELDISSNPKVELSGDVNIDLSGKGELELGKWKLSANGDDCIFSVNAETGELSCYAGEFKVSNWNSVSATRTSAKVDVEADDCLAVYGQDDSKISANGCAEVTLVGHAQGVMNKCKKVIVNDNSRAVAKDCAELIALANARVKASGCAKMEKLDHAKIDTDEAH